MTQLAQEKTEDGGGRSEIRAQRAEGRDRSENIRVGLSTIDGLSRASSATAEKRLTLNNQLSTTASVSLLTGGDDRPYVLGLADALTSAGLTLDVVGSDDLEVPELLDNPRVNFLNLRGDQSPGADLVLKVARVLRYYWRLLYYSSKARAKVFHVLWNNRFEFFDRTLLMVYYKLLGKRIVLTAHNVNMRKRDGTDTWLNQSSLRTQYKLSDHIFVHTDKMKTELVADFHVSENKVSVIPFGINNTVPKTDLTRRDAKRTLGIADSDKTILFFGQIAPYKGLEHLVAAFSKLLADDNSYRLVIAGKPKWNETYWTHIERLMTNNHVRHRVIERIEHVPDEETELYFKAADVLILSYTQVFQSGVIFLGYSFGVPAIVTDVGSLREEVIEGKTGFVCKPRDPSDLATVIRRYFDSELFRDLESQREKIKAYANERYSWDEVAEITTKVYSELLTSHLLNIRSLTSDL